MRRATVVLISLVTIGFSGSLVGPAAAGSNWIESDPAYINHAYVDDPDIAAAPDASGSSQFVTIWTESYEGRVMIKLDTLGNVGTTQLLAQEKMRPMRPHVAIASNGDVVAAWRLGEYGEGGIRVMRLKVQYAPDGTSYLTQQSDSILTPSVAPPDRPKNQATISTVGNARRQARRDSGKLGRRSKRAGVVGRSAATETEGVNGDVEEYRYNREDSLFYERQASYHTITGHIGEPQVGIDGDGNAVVVYQDGQNSVVVAQSSEDHPSDWSKRKVARAEDSVASVWPMLDVNDAGKAAVVWIDVREYVRLQALDFLAPHKAVLNAIRKNPTPTHYRFSLLGKIWDAGKSFSAAKTISSFEISALKDNGGPGLPTVSVGSGGHVVAAWSKTTFEGVFGKKESFKDGFFKHVNRGIEAAYASAGSYTFGKPERVVSSDNKWDDLGWAQSAVDSKGRAYVGWQLATLNEGHEDAAHKLWMSIPNNLAFTGGFSYYGIRFSATVQRGSPTELGVGPFSFVIGRQGLIGTGVVLNKDTIKQSAAPAYGYVYVREPQYRLHQAPQEIDAAARVTSLQVGSAPQRQPVLARTPDGNLIRAADSEGNLMPEYMNGYAPVDSRGRVIPSGGDASDLAGYVYCDRAERGYCYAINLDGTKRYGTYYYRANVTQAGGSISGAIYQGKNVALVGELNGSYGLATDFDPNKNPLTKGGQDWLSKGVTPNGDLDGKIGLQYSSPDGRYVGDVHVAASATGVPSVGMSQELALNEEGTLTGSMNVGYALNGNYGAGVKLSGRNEDGTVAGSVKAGLGGSSNGASGSFGAEVTGDLSGDLHDDDVARATAGITYDAGNGPEASMSTSWGEAVVDDVYDLSIRVATRSASGSWSDPQNPVSHDGNAYIGRLTVGANDSVTLSSDTSTQGGGYKLFATTKGSTGEWGQSTQIFSENRSVKWNPGVGVPPVACNPSGDCKALIEYGGGLMTRALDTRPPVVSVPSALQGELGQPIEFRAIAADMFGMKSIAIDYGDGNAVSAPYAAPMWQGGASHYYDRPGEYTAKVTVVDLKGRIATGKIHISIGVPAEEATQAISTQDRGDLRFTLDSIPSWWLESGQSAVPETTNNKVSVTVDGGKKKVSTVNDPLSLDMESDGSSNTGTVDFTSKPSVKQLIAGGYKGKPAMLIALSKPAKVKVTIYLGKKKVGSFKRKLPAGPRIFMITKYIKSAGTYTIKVRATDENGNRSKTKKTKLRVG